MLRLLMLMVLCSSCFCDLIPHGGTGGGKGGGSGGGSSAGGGLGGGSGVGGGSGQDGGLPPPNLSFFSAVGTGASKLLAEVANVRVEVDPTLRDAITALAACADQVAYCYQPGVLDVRVCLTLAPTCQTQTPWSEGTACCPQACRDAFEVEVAAGLSQVRAFEKVLFLQPDCFPGVRQAIENP